MSWGRKFGPIEHRLSTMTTTPAYRWYTKWLIADAVDQIQGVLKQKGSIGLIQSAFAIEYATVRSDNQGAGSQLDGTYTGGNNERNTGLLTVAAGGAAMFRVGAVYCLSSGSALGEADVSIEGAYESCGEVLGTWEGEVILDNAQEHIIPLGDFVPSMFVQKLKFVVIVNSVVGAIQTGGVYRTAATSIQQASPWKVAAGDFNPSYARVSGATETNSGEVAPNPAVTDMWIQPGICVSGAVGRCHLSVMVIGRRT